MRWFPIPVSSTVQALAVAGLLALLAPAATAQDPASGCTLPPLTLPLFDATPPAIVAATPVSGSDTEPIDEAGIRAAVEIIVTCANSPDPKLSNAIFTERFLAERFADPSSSNLPEFEESLDREAGSIRGSLVLDDVEAITRLDDGRVSVVAVISSSTTTFRDTLILASIGDVWLIDDLGELIPPPRGSGA